MPLNDRSTFENDTIGQNAAGWTINSGAWQVHGTAPLVGAKSYGQPAGSITDSTVTIRSAIVAQADMRIHYKMKAQFINAGTRQDTGAILRYVDANNYYYFNVSTGGQASLTKRVAGVETLLAQYGWGFVFANGDTLNIKAECQGTAMRWKAWKEGTAEPSAWTFTTTDASIAGAGKFGLRIGKEGAFTPAAPTIVDDIRASDAGVDWEEPADDVEVNAPSGGPIGEASSPFTATANGFLASDVTVTPTDNGGGGTFTPTFITLTNAVRSGTFTYTPNSAGTKNITVAMTGEIIQDHFLNFTPFTGTTKLFGAVFSTATGAVGFRADNSDGSPLLTRTTAGVTSYGDGVYSADITLPTDFRGAVFFEDARTPTPRQRVAFVDYQ